MDDRENVPGHEVAVPGQEEDRNFKALPADLGPEKREFTEALRAQFRACELSLRAFGARYHHDHTTVWRYLNALHIPDRDFVEDVLAAVDARVGAPVTAEVQRHLYALHLAALKATSRNRYDNRVLSDQLVAETLQVQAARRQEQVLAEELAQSRARDQQLRLRLRELEAARDEDQIRHGADLVGYQAENSRLRDELHRLRDRITTLQLLLDQAQTRRLQAEARCEHLEQSLAAIEQDTEQERREELRLAEERERRHQHEEDTLRAALAAEQRRAEAREAELAEVRRQFNARDGEVREGEQQQLAETMQVRSSLLDIWSAACAHAMRSGRWTWGDDTGSNSISDARQLLCFLIPATAMPSMRLDNVGDIAQDVSAALSAFGGDAQTPRLLVGALEDYVERYTKPDGTSDFSGGSCLIPLDPAQPLPDEVLSLDLVSAFTVSVQLCLAALGFLEDYSAQLPQPLKPRVNRLYAALSRRLTSALIGLLRSFTMSLMTQESAQGRQLMRLLNQDGLPLHQILALFIERMRVVRSQLGEARLGTAKAREIEDSEFIFEIGWTWGIASDAPMIDRDDRDEPVGAQAVGVAESAPFLYFSMQAAEAIEQLFSERTMALGLLNNDQARLATALRTRRDLALTYWSRLARLGRSWPLEDIPWRTVDGAESDYFTLFVCALLVQDIQQRNANQGDLRRLEAVMSDLADRARITRRPLHDDPAVALHDPGVLISLDTTTPLQTPLGWRINDFAPMLLKRAAQLAVLTGDPTVHDKLQDLAAKVWNHLQERRITAAHGKGMWDDPSRLFSSLEPTDGAVSWSLTSQIVDALVTAGTPPLW